MECKIDYISLSTPYRRRQGVKCVMTTITIHNTGNPTSNALGERAWLVNPTNDREASWHIVVDEHRAVEAIPLDEKALHSGTTAGNTTSIGIEICESGNYAQTLKNAAQLVAKMLKDRGWGVDKLRRHYDWSGKICPRLMYDGGKWTGWTAFKNMVAAELNPPKEEQPMSKDEQTAFDALREDVAGLKMALTTNARQMAALSEQLARTTEQIEPPKWFVSEFGDNVLKMISDPTGTLDFWRSLTVSLRMQGLGKGAVK